jgi:hypothetical protein
LALVVGVLVVVYMYMMLLVMVIYGVVEEVEVLVEMF